MQPEIVNRQCCIIPAFLTIIIIIVSAGDWSKYPRSHLPLSDQYSISSDRVLSQNDGDKYITDATCCTYKTYPLCACASINSPNLFRFRYPKSAVFRHAPRFNTIARGYIVNQNKLVLMNHATLRWVWSRKWAGCHSSVGVQADVDRQEQKASESQWHHDDARRLRFALWMRPLLISRFWRFFPVLRLSANDTMIWCKHFERH